MLIGPQINNILETRSCEKIWLSLIQLSTCQLLQPANKVCEGYVFTLVCQSFCSQGGGPGYTSQEGTPWAGTPPCAGTPPGQLDPPGRYTPWAGTPQAGTPQAGTPQAGTLPFPQPQCMLGHGQQAGSTHPTGMHSCIE